MKTPGGLPMAPWCKGNRIQPWRPAQISFRRRQVHGLTGGCGAGAGCGGGVSCSLSFFSSPFFFVSFLPRSPAAGFEDVFRFSTCLPVGGWADLAPAAGCPASSLPFPASNSRCLSWPSGFSNTGRAGAPEDRRSSGARTSFGWADGDGLEAADRGLVSRGGIALSTSVFPSLRMGA
jgi:hypothetical protein